MIKQIKSVSSVFVMISVMVLLGVGCGGKTDEPTSEIESSMASGTLMITKKDSEKGLLSGTFEYDGYTINFDVARGEVTPLSIRIADNSAYSHAIDARLCDEKHFCFSQQAGGHAFADQSWVPDNSENNGPDDDRAIKNSRTTWKLHQYLVAIGSEDFVGLEEELTSLLNISNSPPEEWGIPIMDVQKEKQLNLGTPQKGVLALKTAATTVYTQQFRIWWKYTTESLAEHSATWTKVMNSSGIKVNELVTCNHGTCANQSQMSPFCTKTFTNRSINIPYNSQCIAGVAPGTLHGVGSGCCGSPFNVLPGNTPSHVCNDDSRFQRDWMILNAVPQSSPYCADIITAIYAPNCG